MYKHCNTEDSARRQRQLEQCLLDMMTDLPYSNITISQICDHKNANHNLLTLIKIIFSLITIKCHLYFSLYTLHPHL